MKNILKFCLVFLGADAAQGSTLSLTGMVDEIDRQVTQLQNIVGEKIKAQYCDEGGDCFSLGKGSWFVSMSDQFGIFLHQISKIYLYGANEGLRARVKNLGEQFCAIYKNKFGLDLKCGEVQSEGYRLFFYSDGRTNHNEPFLSSFRVTDFYKKDIHFDQPGYWMYYPKYSVDSNEKFLEIIPSGKGITGLAANEIDGNVFGDFYGIVVKFWSGGITGTGPEFSVGDFGFNEGFNDLKSSYEEMGNLMGRLKVYIDEEKAKLVDLSIKTKLKYCDEGGDCFRGGGGSWFVSMSDQFGIFLRWISKIYLYGANEGLRARVKNLGEQFCAIYKNKFGLDLKCGEVQSEGYRLFFYFNGGTEHKEPAWVSVRVTDFYKKDIHFDQPGYWMYYPKYSVDSNEKFLKIIPSGKGMTGLAANEIDGNVFGDFYYGNQDSGCYGVVDFWNGGITGTGPEFSVEDFHFAQGFNDLKSSYEEMGNLMGRLLAYINEEKAKLGFSIAEVLESLLTL